MKLSPKQKMKLDRIIRERNLGRHRFQFLSMAEEHYIIAKIQQGDEEALGFFVKNNQGRVVKTAKEFLRYFIKHNLSLEDLVQEGNLGLLEALKKFDRGRKVNFLAFAKWYIWAYIQKAIRDRGALIRIPENKLQRMRRFIAQKSKFGVQDNECQEILKDPLFRRAMEATPEPLSIRFAESGKDDDSDQQAEVQLYNLLRSMFIEQETKIEREDIVRKLFFVLSDRQKEIIELRFGLNGVDNPMTLQQISEHFGVSHGVIRGAQERALGKMKKRAQILGLSFI